MLQDIGDKKRRDKGEQQSQCELQRQKDCGDDDCKIQKVYDKFFPFSIKKSPSFTKKIFVMSVLRHTILRIAEMQAGVNKGTGI